MQTTVYLIRHGELDNPQQIIYGRTAIHLSEEGKEQIKNLGQILKSRNVMPNAIFSSPLQRTKETTEILQSFFPAIPVIYNDYLLEVRTGELTGKPIAFVPKDKDIYDSEYADMHVESRESVTARMFIFFQEIVKQYPEKTILAVSHGDPLIFGIWVLLHPGQPMPPVHELEKSPQTYLQKGKAWKIIIDEKMQASGFEQI